MPELVLTKTSFRPEVLVSILILLFKNLAYGVQQPVPEVSFRYPKIFDETCKRKLKYKIENEWKTELKRELGSFKEAWASHGPKLLRASVEIIGVEFRKKEYHATLTLCDFPSVSHPLLINMRYYLKSFSKNTQSMNIFVSLVHHEILHDYLLGKVPKDSAILAKYKNESRRTIHHIHLLALQKAVYLKLGWPELLKEVIAKDQNMPPYRRAWEIVEIEGHSSIVTELN